MKLIRLLIPFSIGILVFSSCHKIEQVSPRPSIEYQNFTIFDTTDILGNEAKGGRLKFRFQDGDGNVGIMNNPLQDDSTNLFFILYRKVNGKMVVAGPNDPLKPSEYRIPFMERRGQNKIMQGTISVTFYYLFYSKTDTIMYDFWIRDRASNRSNTASTSEIIVSENNVYPNP
jgi:hypothetical protein